MKRLRRAREALFTLLHRRRAIISVASTLCAASLPTAYATSGTDRSAAPAAGAGAENYRPGDTADHVRIKSVKRDSGDGDKAVITIEIDAGFHINANPATFDYLIPTALHITNQAPLRVIYPNAARFKPKFSKGPLDVYEGTVQITAEFENGSLARRPFLFGTVTVQACTEAICLPPADLKLPSLGGRHIGTALRGQARP